jgi:hypothetical protein
MYTLNHHHPAQTTWTSLSSYKLGTSFQLHHTALVHATALPSTRCQHSTCSKVCHSHNQSAAVQQLLEYEQQQASTAGKACQHTSHSTRQATEHPPCLLLPRLLHLFVRSRCMKLAHNIYTPTDSRTCQLTDICCCILPVVHTALQGSSKTNVDHNNKLWCSTCCNHHLTMQHKLPYHTSFNSSTCQPLVLQSTADKHRED